MTTETLENHLQYRFRARDHHAFHEAYRHHAGRMFGTAYLMLHDHGLAADAVQSAFLKAWQAVDGYDPARPLGAWLHAIVRRAAIDIHRRSGRAETVVADHDGLDVPETTDPDLEQVWLAGQVSAALAELPRSERDILTRRYYRGRTLEEIAAELALPVGTVKSRLSRALRKLARRLAHLAG